MIKLGDFGPVRVLRGKHRGRVGYYDDDDDSDGVERAIVYFEKPLVGPYYLIPHRYLEGVDLKVLELEKLAKERPDVVAIVGVKVSR